MSRPWKKKTHRFQGPLVILIGLMAGCSVVTHYPAQMKSSMKEFEEGKLEPAYKKVEKNYGSSLNKLLYLLEGGMILHCQGGLKQSNTIFSDANNLIRAYQEKAVISLSKGTGQLSSLIVNEKTLPYRGEAFERVMVDTFKAMNYLFLQDYEGARVEIRRSFQVQEENRKLHQKEIDRMESEASRKGIQSNTLIREVDRYYQDQQAIVSRVTNPYEDPFAYYLSALVYELNGEYNDAFIDLRRAQKLRPGVPCVENDLLRMAKLSGLWDSLRKWKRTLKKDPVFLDRKTQGEAVIIFECGMAPRKRQIKINLPIPDVGIVSLAFPKYACVRSWVHCASVYDEKGSLRGTTMPLTDVEALVFRNLQDRMPTLVLKQVLRAVAKGAMAKTAKDEGGDLGLLLASAYNIVTEQADLRSWLTLPQNIQVARIPLAAGKHDLVLALQDESGRALQKKPFSLDVNPGGMSFLDVRSGTVGLIDLHAY